MAKQHDLEKTLGLTQSEQRILLYGILCTVSDSSRVTVDFDELARLLGYTPKSAQVMYHNARRKLFSFSGVRPGSTRAGANTTTNTAPDHDGPASTETCNGEDQGTTPNKASKSRYGGYGSTLGQSKVTKSRKPYFKRKAKTQEDEKKPAQRMDDQA